MSDYLVVFYTETWSTISNTLGHGITNVTVMGAKGVTPALLDECKKQIKKENSRVVEAVPINVIRLDEGGEA